MMRKLLFVLTSMLILILVAACSQEETATPEASTATITSPPVVTDTLTLEPPGLPEIEPIPIQQVQSIVWQWAELEEIDPISQSSIADAENYALILWDDNSYAVEADCNQVSGAYAANEGGNLTIEPGATTLAECGPESLSTQFLALLGSATAFGKQGEQMVLLVNDGKGQMRFNNGGPAEKPVPQPEFCAGVTMESVSLDTMDLPYTWQANCEPATPYEDTSPLGPVGLPEHIEINFGETDSTSDQQNDPILYIIRVEDYLNLWETNGDDSLADNLEELQGLIQSQTEPFPTSNLPVLPYEEVTGINDLAVQGRYLTIQLGEALRFVGRFSQSPSPVSNDDPQLFYIFQGFTEDEQYLISYFYPVTTEALPDSEQVTEEERQQFNSDAQGYMAAKTGELNALQPTDWTPNLVELDQVIDSLTFEFEEQPSEPTPVPAAQLTNINWQWTDLTETQPTSQSVIPDPSNYVLTFYNDGSLSITADCNYGSGTYTTQGKEMRIQVGVLTQADCGSDSLGQQFLDLLSNVSGYDLAVARLVLNLADNEGSMGFANRGVSIVAPPGENVPNAVTTEPLNVRSGPGTEYYSYGTVSAGTRFIVIGVSEDGRWWVVQVPTSVASDGRGWISVQYTTATNVENVPVIPTPAVPNTPTPTATGEPEDTPTPTATEEPTPYP